jgi:hypothetical protein
MILTSPFLRTAGRWPSNAVGRDPAGNTLLSGICHAKQFERLKTYLRAFSDLELSVEAYEVAAEFFNTS